MDIAATVPTAPARRPLGRSFLFKLAAGLCLLWLADSLFFFQRVGSTVGLYALLLLAAAAAPVPALRRSPSAIRAAGLALIFALLLVDDPSLLSLALFAAAASMAVLLPKAGGFDSAWRWTKRLLLHALTAPLRPLADFVRLRRARRRHGLRLGLKVGTLVLPGLGTCLFLSLFWTANPVIGEALNRVDLLFLFGGLSGVRILFWLLMAIGLWSLLRPSLPRLSPARSSGAPLDLPGVSPASVTLSLIAFNLLFTIQNGLDVAFLWSGAALPAGMTLADYAHRGAYPLIATALLAGLFVLLTLSPGTETSRSPLIRRLVYAWIAQNVLLVASTMLRTLDYVEAYSLTRLRIAALLWMALVAVGLVLVCWRLWRDRTGVWLVNANAAAALVVLTACAAVDLGAVAAQWNVRHARETGGGGTSIDLCYLNRLGPSALLPLIELEARPLPHDTRERVRWVRNVILDRLDTTQGDWHGWTWRNQRRLDAARAAMAVLRLPRSPADRRGCDGRALVPAAGEAKLLTAPASR